MIETSSPDVLGSLGINGKLFLAQLVNVSVILLVMWRWVYKPLLKTIDARDKKIREGLSNADEAKVLAEQARAEYERVVHEAKLEAREVLATVKREAEELRAQEQAETQKQIAKQLQAAEEKMHQEKQAMLASIRAETADMVVRAVEKVLAGASDAGTQKALVKQSLDELNNTYER